MKYLLDTNGISETRRIRRNPGFDQFFLPVESSRLFLSVLTIGELRKGVINLRRKDIDSAAILEGWVNIVEREFAPRTLTVDKQIATLWGEFSVGRTRPVVDTLLVATAIVHDMTFVTRNVTHVQDLPVKLLNPWSVV